MQDAAIVALYFERNEAALELTQEKYDRYLLVIAQNILANTEDSRESVNDTYLAAWNSIPPNQPQVLSTYLGKITRRIAIDLFRKRNRDKRRASEYAVSLTELEECLVCAETPECVVETRLLTEALERFLRSLPNEARRLFIGRYYFLDSVKEVAAYLHIKQNTYSQYENGQRQLPLECLIALAKLYKTSTDYILGLTDQKEGTTP